MEAGSRMAKRRGNKINVFMHYVWATHERLPLLTTEIERAVYRYIEQVCHDDRCEVLAIGGMPDHIHLLVNMSADRRAMSDMMKRVKGGSSRFMYSDAQTWRMVCLAVALWPCLPYLSADKRKAIEYILEPETTSCGQYASHRIGRNVRRVRNTKINSKIVSACKEQSIVSVGY